MPNIVELLISLASLVSFLYAYKLVSHQHRRFGHPGHLLLSSCFITSSFLSVFHALASGFVPIEVSTLNAIRIVLYQIGLGGTLTLLLGAIYLLYESPPTPTMYIFAFANLSVFPIIYLEGTYMAQIQNEYVILFTTNISFLVYTVLLFIELVYISALVLRILQLVPSTSQKAIAIITIATLLMTILSFLLSTFTVATNGLYLIFLMTASVSVVHFTKKYPYIGLTTRYTPYQLLVADKASGTVVKRYNFTSPIVEEGQEELLISILHGVELSWHPHLPTEEFVQFIQLRSLGIHICRGMHYTFYLLVDHRSRNLSILVNELSLYFDQLHETYSPLSDELRDNMDLQTQRVFGHQLNRLDLVLRASR